MGAVQDLISKGYGGYQGWQDTEAEANFKATGGSGKYTGVSGGGQSSSSSGGDLNSYFEQQNKLQQQAIQPAIQSLQASIPTIQKNTQTQISQKQAEIQPLNDRYKALIDQIKGVGQTSVNKQTVVTANELGKRGIEGSSTLAGQEIASATLPIEQQTQSLVKDTGFAQEADLRDISNTIQNLGGQQTEKEQAIQQAIAQLQSGGGQTAIANAVALLNQQSANESAAQQQAAAMSKGEVQTIGGNKYLVNPYTGEKKLLGAAESGGSDIFSLLSTLLTGGKETKPTTPPKQTVSNDVPDYATPVQTSNVLGQTVTGLGPSDVLSNQTPQGTSWWDSIFNPKSSDLNLSGSYKLR